MDRFTHEHSKVGTTEFQAVVSYEFDLSDPTASGNTGLEGRDEDFSSETLTNEAEAVSYCRNALAAGPPSPNGRVVSFSIRKVEFTEDIYDFEGDTIHDADGEVVARRYGQPTDDNTIEWEDWENES